MAHKIFICHSSKDKMVADAACAALEARRISCWIAPRDILAGDEYGSAIVEAISSSEIVLIIFSRHVNESPQCRREIERAVSKERIIVPFRIENILPSGSLEYALSNTHWLDALTPPMENSLNELADTVAHILQRREGIVPPPRDSVPVRPIAAAVVETKKASSRVVPAVIGAAAVLAAVAAGLFLYHGKAEPAAEPVKQPVAVNAPVPQVISAHASPSLRASAQPKPAPVINNPAAPPPEPVKLAIAAPSTPPPPPPAPVAAAAPMLSAEQKARLDQVEMKIDELSNSAESANTSLNSMAQSMQKQGMTLNGKWTTLQAGMNSSLTKAREALKAQDADRAERFASVADSNLSQIKTFLGR